MEKKKTNKELGATKTQVFGKGEEESVILGQNKFYLPIVSGLHQLNVVRIEIAF